MLRDLWDDLQNDKEKHQQTFKSQLVELETEQENIIKRLMSTHIASVIQAYEQRIEKMELEKAVLHEKISNCGRKVGSFDESFRTAAISMPFRVLEALDNHDSIMAETEGFEPSMRL